MRSAHKFLFDTSFDQAQPPASAPDRPQPRHSETDLSAARDEGFAAGRAGAIAEVEARIERTAARALEAIAGALSELFEARAAAGRSYIQCALETALAIARKLHPELTRRRGLTEVEGVLRQCLETRRDEPRLVVRVADGLLDALSERIDPLTREAGFEGRVVLLADDSIAPGDCRVEWADGGAERNSAALWEDIEAAIGRALADPAADSTTALPADRGKEATPSPAMTDERDDHPQADDIRPRRTP